VAKPLCPGAGSRPAQSQPAPGLGRKRGASADTNGDTDAASGCPIQLGKGRHRAFAQAGATDTGADNGADAEAVYCVLTVKRRRWAFVVSPIPTLEPISATLLNKGK
jgi:hypothetical protein